VSRAETSLESRPSSRVLIATGFAFVAVSGVYAVLVQGIAGVAGFPLDDGFIHLQFARNLVETGTIAFNAGIPSSGDTAPGYVFLLAAVGSLVPDWIAASYALGALCVLGMALAAGALVQRATGDANRAACAAALCLVAGPAIPLAYSGMEAPLYACLYMIGLLAYGSPRVRPAASLAWAAAVWVRPEMLLLVVLVAFERLASRSGARELGAHAAVWIAVVGLWLAFHHQLDGHYVPSTFAAKAVAGNGGMAPWFFLGVPGSLARGSMSSLALALTLWPALALVSAIVMLLPTCLPLTLRLGGALRDGWRSDSNEAPALRIAALSLVAFPLAHALVDPLRAWFWYQFERYYAHVIPAMVVVALASRSIPLRPRTFVALAVPNAIAWSLLAAFGVRNIDALQGDMARWLLRERPAASLVATNDIGALGFLTRRTILDTVGLVEPDLVRDLLQGGTVLGYLSRKRPDVVIIFPNWYPELASHPAFREIHRESVDRAVVSGGEALVAYQVDWSLVP
jgi:hypothetical protein